MSTLVQAAHSCKYFKVPCVRHSRSSDQTGWAPKWKVSAEAPNGFSNGMPHAILPCAAAFSSSKGTNHLCGIIGCQLKQKNQIKCMMLCGYLHSNVTKALFANVGYLCSHFSGITSPTIIAFATCRNGI